MPEHTPEPWKRNGPWIVAPKGATIAMPFCLGLSHSESEKRISGDECDANIDRIVACVNACAGISNGTLAAISYKGLAEQLGRANCRIDELVVKL